MIAYHGKQSVKDFYIDRVRKHREADELVRGKYWENGRGCAVGCCVHSSSHAAYEVELGIPRLLARLEDITFERLKNAEAMVWPEQFLEAIPVGADLSMVWPQYALWMLSDPSFGVLRCAKTERTRAAIERVTALYRQWVERGVQPEVAEFRAAAAAAAADADADAAAADDAAAYADAAYDAYAAAYADADAYAYADAAADDAAAAADAAADAAYDAYAADARTSFWRASAAKLLELLAAAPVGTELAKKPEVTP